MSGDFDRRDIDSRERDDGIHDREEEWLGAEALVQQPSATVLPRAMSEVATTIGEKRAIVNTPIAMTIAASIPAMCSCATWICRAGLSGSWSTTAIATTR
jgi:hypothetical protein